MLGYCFNEFKMEENNKRCVLPYKLIGDVAYPMRPWLYYPFKGENDGLSRPKIH